MSTVQEIHDTFFDVITEQGVLCNRVDREAVALRARARIGMAPVVAAVREVAVRRLPNRSALEALAHAGEVGPLQAYDRGLVQARDLLRGMMSEADELHRQADRHEHEASLDDDERQAHVEALAQLSIRVPDMEALREAMGSDSRGDDFLREILWMEEDRRTISLLSRLADRPLRLLARETRTYARRHRHNLLDDIKRRIDLAMSISALARSADQNRTRAGLGREQAVAIEKRLSRLPDRGEPRHLAFSALEEAGRTLETALVLHRFAGDLFPASLIAAVASGEQLLRAADALLDDAGGARLFLERLQKSMPNLRHGRDVAPETRIPGIDIGSVRALSGSFVRALTPRISAAATLREAEVSFQPDTVPPRFHGCGSVLGNADLNRMDEAVDDATLMDAIFRHLPIRIHSEVDIPGRLPRVPREFSTFTPVDGRIDAASMVFAGRGARWNRG